MDHQESWEVLIQCHCVQTFVFALFTAMRSRGDE